MTVKSSTCLNFRIHPKEYYKEHAKKYGYRMLNRLVEQALITQIELDKKRKPGDWRL